MIRFIVVICIILSSLSYAKTYTEADILQAAAHTKISDFDIHNKIKKSTLEYSEYMYENNKKAYELQHTQTITIAFVVHFMIFFGLYMAYIQFKNNKTEPTSLKVNKDGVEIKSNIIGLIILVISFSFYYVYIKDVYSIKITGQEISRKSAG